MWSVITGLYNNLVGLNDQVAKARQYFERLNEFLDSKTAPPAEGDAAPAIEDRTSKNGNGRKIVTK